LKKKHPLQYFSLLQIKSTGKLETSWEKTTDFPKATSFISSSLKSNSRLLAVLSKHLTFYTLVRDGGRNEPPFQPGWPSHIRSSLISVHSASVAILQATAHDSTQRIFPKGLDQATKRRDLHSDLELLSLIPKSPSQQDSVPFLGGVQKHSSATCTKSIFLAWRFPPAPLQEASAKLLVQTGC